MSSILAAISIFPETRMWRVKKEPQVNHVCGGIATIILVGVVLAITIIQVRDVFSRTKITVSHERKVDIGSHSVLSTYQNDPTLKPIMIAVDTLGMTEAIVEYVKNGTPTTLNLEPCTTYHFSNASHIQGFLLTQNISTWKCLPLNQLYEIGSQTSGLGSIARYLNIFLACPAGTNCAPASQGGLRDLYIQEALVNPNNKSQFWQESIQKFSFPRMLLTGMQINYQFTQTNLNQNEALFPFETKQTNTEGYQLSDLVSSYFLSNPRQYFYFHFFKSPKQEIYSVKYYTILDALSYVGGIFNAIVALFFFIHWYGQSLVQLFLAHSFFRSKDLQHFSFFGYIKQSLYKILVQLNCKPNWQQAQKRQGICQTMSNLMDVVYLQQRIQFLEKSLTIIFDKHQLKGLHLLHRFQKKQVDQNFKQYQLRDKIIYYFKQRFKDQQQSNATQSIKKQIVCKKPEKSQSMDFMESRADNIAKDMNATGKLSNNSNKNPKQKVVNKKTSESLSSVRPMNATIDKKIQCLSMQESEYESELQKMENEELFFEIEEEFGNDLSTLLRQATTESGDEKSKRIVQRIDRKMMELIQEAVRKEQQYRYRYACHQ